VLHLNCRLQQRAKITATLTTKTFLTNTNTFQHCASVNSVMHKQATGKKRKIYADIVHLLTVTVLRFTLFTHTLRPVVNTDNYRKLTEKNRNLTENHQKIQKQEQSC